MMALGVVYILVYHSFSTPIFNNWLIQCIVFGLLFGFINFLMVYYLQHRNNKLKNKNILLNNQLRLDQLTGLFNRRAFDEDLGNITKEEKYSVLFLDVDNFREFNNQYGHDVGDIVLKKVAETTRSNLRAGDAVYRYGGEEIVALLRECGKEEAKIVAEKLRTKLSDLNNYPYPNITVSIGVASYPEDSSNILQVVEYADKALLLAKSSGKNCCMFN